MARLLPQFAGWLLAVLSVLVGCGPIRARTGAVPIPLAPNAATEQGSVPVRVQQAALRTPAQSCSHTFVVYKLDHTTTGGATRPISESNGSGVAINDLDGDGDLDLVLANLSGSNTIFWNEGSLHFRKEALPFGGSRAVNVVDVDGDGRQDLVFTRRAAAPTFLRNHPGGARSPRLIEEPLAGINERPYAMTWGDLDGDGDLDLVAGSYDAALESDLGYHVLFTQEGRGVYFYENDGGRFVSERLSRAAQALAIALPDFNGDGQPDILAGNDFAVPDQAWQREDGRWIEVTPFARTSRNTMSLDLGDIDNDGSVEIFATDMKPYEQGVKTLASWRTIMAQIPQDTFLGDPQIVENVLQIRDQASRFSNQAYERAVDATGWSWSGKFGDLDNDGFLDLYVVNGSIAAGLLDHLPGSELVEQNQALHNDGKGYFRRAPEWGLGATASGRGMSMADLDDDGDLDIVVNNVEQPAELFENRLCGGAAIEVDLFWPRSKNSRAIGTQLVLHTSAGSYYRDVRAASGYLSGEPARVHFGVPRNATLERLEIRWPDGSVSSTTHVRPQTLLSVTR